MDTDQRLSGQEADERLRKLFQAAGPLTAADDLEARVLSRLNEAPAAAPVVVRPLVGRWGWVAVAAVLALLIWSVSSGSPSPAGPSLPEIRLPDMDAVLRVATSRWTLMGALCGALLLLLDTLLRRLHPATHAA